MKKKKTVSGDKNAEHNIVAILIVSLAYTGVGLGGLSKSQNTMHLGLGLNNQTPHCAFVPLNYSTQS